MQKGFKIFLVIFGVLLAVATIAEIRNPAALDGFGVQWPVYVAFWLGYAAAWIWGTRKGRPGR